MSTKPEGEKYTVAVDFDGVLHEFTSAWVNPHTIPDPAVDGAMEFLDKIAEDFQVVIFTTRGRTWRGRRAIREWLRQELYRYYIRKWRGHDMLDFWQKRFEYDQMAHLKARELVKSFDVTDRKRAALVYIDDRAWHFEGNNFPTKEQIHRAIPWNKKGKTDGEKKGPTSEVAGGAESSEGKGAGVRRGPRGVVERKQKGIGRNAKAQTVSGVGGSKARPQKKVH